MNIFWLDNDPIKCAAYHVDKHVPKMVVELAQLLAVCHDEMGTWVDGMYKPTHRNHPCAIWVRESKANYLETVELLKALIKEYSYRYYGFHKTQEQLYYLAEPPCNLPDIGSTPKALAMPDEFKVDCPVQSYRNYYKVGKANLHSWKNRPVPDWILEEVCES